MTFVYGRQLFFRYHTLRGEQYSFMLDSRENLIRPHIQLTSCRTFADSVRDMSSCNKLNGLLADLYAVGMDGIEAWYAEYERWERFILPSMDVLSRDGVFAEDVILSTPMDMEVTGKLINECDGKECLKGRGRNLLVTLYIHRCSRVLELKLPDEFNGMAALSRATTNTYNAIKHLSHGSFFDSCEARIIRGLNKLIVRLLALHVTKVDLNAVIQNYISLALDNIVTKMSRRSMSADGDGKRCYEI